MGDPLNPLISGINTFGSQGKSMENTPRLPDSSTEFSHTFSAEGAVHMGPQSRIQTLARTLSSAYLYDTRYSYSRSDFDIKQSFKVFGVWQPVIISRSQAWRREGRRRAGRQRHHDPFRSGYGWTPTFTGATPDGSARTCGYGYQSLRPYLSWRSR